MMCTILLTSVLFVQSPEPTVIPQDRTTRVWQMPQGDTCRQRLADALRKVQPYLPHDAPWSTWGGARQGPLIPDPEAGARWRAEEIRQEKALAAEVDAVLRECP
jgi:hypothetical protein